MSDGADDQPAGTAGDPPSDPPYVVGPPAERRVLTPGGWPASPFRRFGGYLVDSVLLLAVVAALSGIGEALRPMGSDGEPIPIPTWWRVLLWAIPTAYVIVAIGRWGRTIGQRVAGMRIARLDDGQPPGWGPAVVRWAVVGVPAAVTSVLGLGDAAAQLATWWGVIALAALLVDLQRHQGLHDRAAKVVVVEVEPRRLGGPPSASLDGWPTTTFPSPEGSASPGAS